MIAAKTPAKSSASSDTTRENRRSVAMRRRNESAGGRLRLMSVDGSVSGREDARTGSGGLVLVSGIDASGANNAAACHRFWRFSQHWVQLGAGNQRIPG